MRTTLSQSISREALNQLNRNLDIIRESSLERLAKIHDLKETLLEKFNTDWKKEKSNNINVQG